MTELKGLEEQKPEHREHWMDRYNVERAKSGIEPISPLGRYEQEYNEVMGLPVTPEASSSNS